MKDSVYIALHCFEREANAGKLCIHRDTKRADRDRWEILPRREILDRGIKVINELRRLKIEIATANHDLRSTSERRGKPIGRENSISHRDRSIECLDAELAPIRGCGCFDDSGSSHGTPVGANAIERDVRIQVAREIRIPQKRCELEFRGLDKSCVAHARRSEVEREIASCAPLRSRDVEKRAEMICRASIREPMNIADAWVNGSTDVKTG